MPASACPPLYLPLPTGVRLHPANRTLAPADSCDFPTPGASAAVQSGRKRRRARGRWRRNARCLRESERENGETVRASMAPLHRDRFTAAEGGPALHLPAPTVSLFPFLPRSAPEPEPQQRAVLAVTFFLPSSFFSFFLFFSFYSPAISSPRPIGRERDCGSRRSAFFHTSPTRIGCTRRRFVLVRLA